MSRNVCRYLTFSIAIAKENVAKPLQISAVVRSFCFIIIFTTTFRLEYNQENLYLSVEYIQ